MWTPKRLSINNLFSHQQTVYDFKVGQFTLLLGKNGHGKSTIPDAITLALTGNVWRGVGKTSFIRRGEDYCSVLLALDHHQTKRRLVIMRQFYRGDKSAKLQMWMITTDRDDVTPADEIKAQRASRTLQEELYSLLGIAEEDLLNYYIIGQKNYNSFYSATDTQQKKVIERFSNYGGLDKVIEAVEADIADIDAEIQKARNSITASEQAAQHLQQQIAELESEDQDDGGKADLESKVTKQRQKIADARQYLVDAAQQTKEHAKLTNRIKSQLEQFDVPKIAEQVEEYKTARQNLQDEIQDANRLKRELETTLAGQVTCPNCKHVFVPDSDTDIDTAMEAVQQIQTFLAAAKETEADYKATYTDLKDQLRRYDVLEEEWKELDLNFSGVQQGVKNAQAGIKAAEQLIKTYEEQIAAIKKGSSNAKQIQNILKRIEQLNAEALALSKGVLQHQKQREALQWHVSQFGKVGFKTFLANKSIRTIQDITNFYLQKFSIDLQVMISGYTVTKSGDTKEKITIWVMDAGREMEVYAAHSGGEQGSLDICGILAIHKIINNSSPTGGLDLLILDEKIQALDSDFSAEALRLLEQAGVTSIAIMHGVADVPVKNKLYAIKQDSPDGKVTTLTTKAPI